MFFFSMPYGPRGVPIPKDKTNSHSENGQPLPPSYRVQTVSTSFEPLTWAWEIFVFSFLSTNLIETPDV